MWVPSIIKSELTVKALYCVTFATCWVLLRTLYININSLNPRTSVMWVLLLSPLDRWGELRHGEAKSLDQHHRPAKFGWTGLWTQAVGLRCLALTLRRHACPASSCPQRRTRFLASRPLFDSLTLNLSPRGSPQHTDLRSCPNCTPGGLALHQPVYFNVSP